MSSGPISALLLRPAKRRQQAGISHGWRSKSGAEEGSDNLYSVGIQGRAGDRNGTLES